MKASVLAVIRSLRSGQLGRDSVDQVTVCLIANSAYFMGYVLDDRVLSIQIVLAFCCVFLFPFYTFVISCSTAVVALDINFRLLQNFLVIHSFRHSFV